VLGLFASKPFRDGRLGELSRSGRYWKGSLEIIPCGTFRLAVVGSHERPDPNALALAKEFPDRFGSLMGYVEIALFEHYEPYKEAVDAEKEIGSPCPNILGSKEVWSHPCQPMS
jgi:hypothetical protein